MIYIKLMPGINDFHYMLFQKHVIIRLYILHFKFRTLDQTGNWEMTYFEKISGYTQSTTLLMHMLQVKIKFS